MTADMVCAAVSVASVSLYVLFSPRARLIMTQSLRHPGTDCRIYKDADGDWHAEPLTRSITNQSPDSDCAS